MIICFQGFWLALNPASAQAQELTFEQFLQKASQTIEKVTSNSKAQALVESTMGAFVQAGPHAQNRKRQKNNTPLPDSLIQQIGELAANTAMWHFATKLETTVQTGKESQHTFIPMVSNPHIEWIKSISTQSQLPHVIQLATIYFELRNVQESPHAPLPFFAPYSQHLHQQFSTLTDGHPGWLTIAEKEGVQGLTLRLYEYWKNEALHNTAIPEISLPDQDSYAARYLHQHYLPLHQAYLQTAVVKLQIDSERKARIIWSRLREWQKEQTNAQGLFRLCGTWQWLIHNHQNHGDHKTLMIYPPPSQYDRMDPKPATIQVQGDTVYIRWEFPRGIIQEESLLFSEKDRALSGTFVNNLGPNGNITARLLKPCAEQ